MVVEAVKTEKSPVNEVYEAYRKAKEVLVCRMIAEPYNMVYVFDQLHPAMFELSDYYAAACMGLYRERKMYSAFTVAARANELNHPNYTDSQCVAEEGRSHTDTALPEAFEHFRFVYGQYVEQQISANTAYLIDKGLGSEEIKIEQDKMRRQRGLGTARVTSDGKAEFESALENAIEGRSVDYPVKPALAAMRKKIQFYEPGEYVVAAARTGMGKSYWALNEAYAMAKAGVPVLINNLENTIKGVNIRLWQMETGIQWQPDFTKDWWSVRNGVWQLHDTLTAADVEWMRAGWATVKSLPIKIVNVGRQLQNIVAVTRQDYYERGTQAFYYDYIQLMRDSEKRQKVDDLAEVSATLRGLALDLSTVVVALAQISREGEKRNASHRPGISDIRSCGDLEQDASTVLLLYRPKEYGIKTDEDGNEYPREYADVHIGKGRNCGPGMVKCRYNHVEGFYDEADEWAPLNQGSAMFPAAPSLAPFNQRKEPDDKSLPF